MTGMLERVKAWFTHSDSALKDEAAGGEPVATPPASADDERETSTNAQPSGATGEPWSSAE